MSVSSNIPHKTTLPEGIRPGTVLRIRGFVPDQAGRNLMCSFSCPVPLWLRFPRPPKCVEFQTLKTQRAQEHSDFGLGGPFQRGQPFEVLLIATEDGFKAVIGDAQYHHFRHRLPLARVRLVEVGGDVKLESLKIF
uniref:Galectin n=1 Tax=Otolemur garnettii TaxID=30611 RepID=H0WMF5_OTOGA